VEQLAASAAGVRRQEPAADPAARTAASTWPGVALGTSASSASVAGLWTGSARPAPVSSDPPTSIVVRVRSGWLDKVVPPGRARQCRRCAPTVSSAGEKRPVMIRAGFRRG